MTKRSPTARPHADRIPRVPVGPLAPTVLGECSRWLAAQGYSPGSAAGIVNLLGRLSLWMREVGAGVDDIDEALLARFIAAERSREVVCVTVKSSMGTMRRFLTAAGYLGAAEVDTSQLTPAQAAVAQWCSWMRDQRGLTEKSIAARCHYAAGLLDELTTADGSVQWCRLDASIVNAYVAQRGRPYGVVTRAHIVDAVRCLLRWALSTGHLDRDLSAGILKPAGTRRGLPRGVGAEQVAALLAVCDPATAIGARDRAVVMILVRLGLRAGEVARLNLDDIDWANGRLKVTGKGREHTLPIPVDVGQALDGLAEASTGRVGPGGVRADEGATHDDGDLGDLRDRRTAGGRGGDRPDLRAPASAHRGDGRPGRRRHLDRSQRAPGPRRTPAPRWPTRRST